MSNKAIVRRRADEIINDEVYIKNWFGEGADRFFGEEYITGVLRGCYFITKDDFMNQTIYALRKITPKGIETIEGPLKSREEALEVLKGEVKQ